MLSFAAIAGLRSARPHPSPLPQGEGAKYLPGHGSQDGGALRRARPYTTLTPALSHRERKHLTGTTGLRMAWILRRSSPLHNRRPKGERPHRSSPAHIGPGHGFARLRSLRIASNVSAVSTCRRDRRPGCDVAARGRLRGALRFVKSGPGTKEGGEPACHLSVLGWSGPTTRRCASRH